MRYIKEYFFLYLAIAISAFANQSYGQQPPKIEWQKCYGGSFNEVASKIIQTHDGNFVIAGYTLSDDGFVSGFHGASGDPGANDAWVINIDPDGRILWQKCLGGTASDFISCVIETSDGGYAVAGSTSSNDGDVSGNHGGIDAWVVKLDIDGNIQWQKCLGGSGNDAASCITESKDEGRGFLIAGWTFSNDGDVSGKHSTSKTSDLWVVKLSQSGTIEWQKCFGGSGDDQAESVIQTTDHGYAIVGNTNSHDGDVTGLHIGKNSSHDIWVVKLSGSGAIEWQKCLGGSYEEVGKSIIQISDGGYAIAGGTNSNDGDVNGLHGEPSSFDGVDAWIIKLNSSGNIKWQKCLGGSLPDYAYSIIQTHSGDYVITGSTASNDGDVSGIHVGQFPIRDDIWVVKMDSAQHIIWQKCLGGKEQDIGASIIQTSEGGYAIGGWTASNDGDVSGNNSKANLNGSGIYSDFWVVKLGAEVNAVENSFSDQTNFLSVFPNPSFDKIHLQLYHSLSVKQVQFYNLLGIQYYPDYRIENTIASIDAHSLPAGSYVMRVSYLNSDIEEVRKFLLYH